MNVYHKREATMILGISRTDPQNLTQISPVPFLCMTLIARDCDHIDVCF